jgi:hypothetical protein
MTEAQSDFGIDLLHYDEDLMASDTGSHTVDWHIRDNIPDELQRLKQWVLWKYVDRGDKKPGKAPVVVDSTGNLRGASATNPNDWMSFEDALAFYQEGSRVDGIGFIFAPDGEWFGIDLDNCFADDGALRPWAQNIHDAFMGVAYIEKSPSGKGLHILAKARLPEHTLHKFSLGSGGQAIELYCKDRYFTVTGYGKYPAEGAMDAQPAVDKLVEQYFLPQPVPQAQPARKLNPVRSDDEVLALLLAEARRSSEAGDHKLADLIEGLDDLYDGDASRGDAALVAKVRHYAYDDAQAERVMMRLRRAEVRKEKWDTKRGSLTYLQYSMRRLWEPDATYEGDADPSPPLDTTKKPTTRRPTLHVLADVAPHNHIYLPPYVDTLIGIGCALLFAAPKSGKTWLSLQWGIDVALGRRTLGGALDTRQTGVLYLAFEDKVPGIRRRAQMLLGAEPIPRNFLACDDWPKQDEGGMEELDAFLTETPDYRLVIIDTLASFKSPPPRGLNAVDTDYRRADLLNSLALKHEAAIILVGHAVKRQSASDSQGAFLEDINATGGLAAAASTVMQLKLDKPNTAKLLVTGRNVADQTRLLVKSAISVDADADSDEAAPFTWKLANAAEEAEAGNARQRILAAFRQGERLGLAEITERVSPIPYATVKRVAARMADAGQLNREGKLYALPPTR